MRQFAWLSILLVLASVPALAVGRHTVDPNACGARVTEPAADSTPMPEVKVTYEARHKPVRDVVSDLAEMTGANLKCGRSSSDWHVRDRRISIFVKDVPLSDLMKSIARTMRFIWVRDASDPKAARLVMDRKAVQAAQSRRTNEQARLAKLRAEKQDSVLKSYAGLQHLSTAELNKLHDEQPFSYVLAASGMAELVTSLFAHCPQVREAMNSGGFVELEVAGLPASVHQALTKTVSYAAEAERRMSGGDPGSTTELPGRLAEASIVVGFGGDEARANPENLSVIGTINVNAEGANMDIPMMDPASESAQKMGGMILGAMEFGVNGPEEAPDWSSVEETWEDETEPPDTGDPLVEHPEDAALAVKVSLKLGEEPSTEDILAALHEASKMGVVADAGANGSWSEEVRSGGTIRELLDWMADEFRFNWAKRNGVLEFTDRDWLENRALQLPDSQIERWRSILRKTGTLDLPVLAEIAALTTDQIQANLMDGELDIAAYNAQGNSIVQLYLGLGSGQRSALFGEGIPISDLNPRLGDACDRVGQLSEDTTGVVLRCTKRREGKAFVYELRANLPDGSSRLLDKLHTGQVAQPDEPMLP